MTLSVDKQKQSKITRVYQQNEVCAPDWNLVRQYLPLLKSIVSKMIINFPPTTDRESVYTIGLLGLISASQTYQTVHNCGFGTYAGIRIKGALLDELRRLDWLPRTLRTRLKDFKQKLAKCESKLGRNLSDEEICNYLHINLKELCQIKELSKPFVFIPLELNYENINSENNENLFSLEEKIADTTQQTGLEICEKNEIKQMLKTYLAELPKTTQQLLALHYNEGLCLSEIAMAFNLSESRVCQMHADAIVKLRNKLLKSLKD